MPVVENDAIGMLLGDRSSVPPAMAMFEMWIRRRRPRQYDVLSIEAEAAVLDPIGIGDEREAAHATHVSQRHGLSTRRSQPVDRCRDGIPPIGCHGATRLGHNLHHANSISDFDDRTVRF